MKTLSQLVLEIQTYFLAVVSKKCESIDDYEDRDMALESIEQDCEFISTELQEQPEAYDSVLSFSKLLKEYGEYSMVKKLEIGLAYASLIVED
tara:strand:- start:22261 stop:22539 length:279 start_codon:yes stop_codon:yes gene_type:complete